MAPMTRHRHQAASTHSARTTAQPSAQQGDNDDAADSSSDDSSVEDEERMTVLSSTTGITYGLDELPESSRRAARQAFRRTPLIEPPTLVPQWCRLGQDKAGNNEYAVQMLEVVHRSVRIGRNSPPNCSCMLKAKTTEPCRHVISLLDQVNCLTTAQDVDAEEQYLGSDGASMELGNAHDRISDYHLDLLADGLYCEMGSPDPEVSISPARIRATREVVAMIADQSMSEQEILEYRPDIFADPCASLCKTGIIYEGDIERTLVNSLLTNDLCFAQFRKLLKSSSTDLGPFREVQQLVEGTLSRLDNYTRDPAHASTSPSEGPCDVPWATARIQGAVSKIRALLQRNRREPVTTAEASSAARALVQILSTIVQNWNRDIPYFPDRQRSNSANPGGGVSIPTSASTPHTTDAINNRNLYMRLIGNNKRADFIIDVLTLLPEQSQWIDELVNIADIITQHSAPANYLRKLNDLIARLRRSSRSKMARGGGVAGSSSRSLQAQQDSGERQDLPAAGLAVEVARGSKRPGTSSGREGSVKKAR